MKAKQEQVLLVPENETTRREQLIAAEERQLATMEMEIDRSDSTSDGSEDAEAAICTMRGIGECTCKIVEVST